MSLPSLYHSTAHPQLTPRQRLMCQSVVLLGVLLLVLIVTLRGATRDTDTYQFTFQETTAFPSDPAVYYENFGMEWTYGIISWAVKSLGGNFSIVLFIYSTLTFLFLFLSGRNVGISFQQLLPFYLGSFFIVQQLMQIRQGLAVAFAFYALTRCITQSTRRFEFVLSTVITAMFHLVSVMPLLIGRLAMVLPSRVSKRVFLWRLALIFFMAVTVSHVVSGLQFIGIFDRLAQYSEDAEYGSARGLFALANIRAFTLCLLFVYALDRGPATRGRAYKVLLTMYVIHLAIRIGFLSFAIVSGRLSTAIGFAEVFLLPMVLNDLCAKRRDRTMLAMIYLAVHLYMTLFVQADYILVDYFRPLP